MSSTKANAAKAASDPRAGADLSPNETGFHTEACFHFSDLKQTSVALVPVLFVVLILIVAEKDVVERLMILKRKTAPLVPPERVARVHDEDRAAFGREHHFNAGACSILIPRDVVGKPPIARQAVGGRTLESLEICVVAENGRPQSSNPM